MLVRVQRTQILYCVSCLVFSLSYGISYWFWAELAGSRGRRHPRRAGCGCYLCACPSWKLAGRQNISNPGCVVRLRLDGVGTRVRAVEILESHHPPAYVEPTRGVIVGRRLKGLGTTQVSRLQGCGTLRDEPSLRRPEIVDVPLSK